MRALCIRIAAGLAVIAALSVTVMMAITALDVAKRALTGSSLAGAQEITESLIVTIVYLGIAWAQYRREHVAIDLFTARLPARTAAAVRAIGQIIVVGIVTWMLVRTGSAAWEAFKSGEVRFGLLQLPMWPARAAIPLGLLALLLIVFVGIWDQLSAFTTRTAPGDHAPAKAMR